METTGNFHRFTPSLNPTAQEFRPTYPNPNSIPPPSPSTYYSFPYPYNFNYNYNHNYDYSCNNNPPPPPPVAVTVPVQVPVPVHVPPPLPPPSTTATRALLLSSVPSDVSESIVRRDLELFGDVRAVQMEKVRDGLVTVHFYDLRQATEALHEIQEQHMQQQYRLRKHFDSLAIFSPENYSPTTYFHHANTFPVATIATPPVPLPPPAPGLVAGRAVWAQFTFPVAGGFPDSYNQGTLVVFNLNSDVSTGMLKGIFEAFGPVKELRRTPSKRNQKFVEFYDTRDASKALININGQVINGQPVVVEFSRPGGHKFGPKHGRFVNLSSNRSPPRKFATEPRQHYRPPPPPPPPPQQARKIGKKLQPESFGGGSWSKQRKGFRRERDDPRFLIKEDGVISEANVSDSRTTVMIKNIPNKYSQKLLLNMLDSHCIHCNEQITGGDGVEAGGGSGFEQPLSSYDFVYLPIDFMNKCNVGYGFVNTTSPEATMRLYKAFHHKNWEVFNSKKICEVSYARLQGLDALKEHFKNSKFPNEAEEYMPVVFDPPRDGRRLTQPTSIVGRNVPAASDHNDLSLTDSECCNSSSNATVVEEDVESDPNDDDDTHNIAAAASYSGGGDDE